MQSFPQFTDKNMTTLSLFQWRVSQSPTDIAVRYWARGEWTSVTWAKYAELVRTLSLHLQANGLTRGDRIAVFAETCFEWALVDLAAQAFGGVVVAIHPSYSLEEVLHALYVSEAKVLFYGGDKPAQTMMHVAGTYDQPLVVYNFDQGGRKLPSVQPFSTLLVEPQQNRRSHPDRSEGEGVQDTDVATLVFTSGTSGMPKAVCLTQRNLVATALASYRHLGFTTPRPKSLHWLPFAHLFGRIGMYLDLVAGGSATYSRGLQHLPEDLRVAQPHFLFAVPKALSRFQSGILKQVGQQALWRRLLFRGGLTLMRQTLTGIAQRPQTHARWAAVHALVKAFVFRRVTSSFGGNLQLIIVGSAPVASDLCGFFEAFGIAVLEGYGMTETSGVAFVNPCGKELSGSVGTPIDTVLFRITPDQELLVRGDSICKGYLDSADNEAAFTEDGWFRTGDLAEVNADGYLKIVGRKKDIIITDGGENITPERIEAILASYPLIKDAVLIGDQKPYVVAVLNVDGSAAQSPASLRESVQQIVDEVNHNLAKFEVIRSFVLVKEDFSIDNGELTASFKKRRKVIEQRYRPEIEALYEQETRYAGVR